MISFLIGSIEEKRENQLILNVNNVGFEMNISSNTYSSLGQKGEVIKIWTYMVVKEDDISLCGFSTIEEKDLFLQLITVSGIGPKTALSILSCMPISDLTIAIIKNDSKILSKVKGLGKKTAERVCLELKDKLSPISLHADDLTEDSYDEDAVQMATDTLISLGINKNDAYMLARSYAANSESAEEIISKALRGYKG